MSNKSRFEKWRDDLRSHKSRKRPIKRLKVKDKKQRGFWKALDEFS